jgi:integrase
MAKTLTARSIETAKPLAVRQEIPDGGCRGLHLVVQPSGQRSWAIRFRIEGRTAKHTLGSWPAISLAQARRLAAAAMAQVAQGTDPRDEKRKAKADAAERGRDTVARLAALFLEQHARRKTRPNSWQQAEGLFRREILPAWGNRPITDIRKRDTVSLVEAVAVTRPVMANRLLTCLSRFFRWCANRDVIAGSPCVGVERPTPEPVRDRCLSDDEVRAFWAATGSLPAHIGDVFRLLLLSGARAREIGNLRWTELNFADQIWTLPAARNKAKVDLERPLGPLAWEILAAQPRAPSEFVFSRCRGLNHMKVRLDQVMRVEGWRIHDLRRTARSLLSRGHVRSDTAELCLGHLLAGMRKVYDRHSYVDEKRAAYAVLEREIDHILSPPEAAVIRFPR